jgi:hypothetical protein
MEVIHLNPGFTVHFNEECTVKLDDTQIQKSAPLLVQTCASMYRSRKAEATGADGVCYRLYIQPIDTGYLRTQDYHKTADKAKVRNYIHRAYLSIQDAGKWPTLWETVTILDFDA